MLPVRQPIFILFLLFALFNGKAQQVSFKGSLNDTSTHQALPGAVIMALKYTDSTLVKFTRSDEKGFFEMEALPLDTYRVVISHKNFGDKTLFLIGSAGNYQFEFFNIGLPPKSTTLEEVTIFAFKDPVYYKGDTIVYTADSFKVKPNATVEDLLRRLPGIRVDAAGKITAQGKEVNKVLVDGDEFFGSDPTMATRNLAAGAVESVQIYEKKDDESGSGDDKENIQIMNLKLKDNAKKGYFGKLSASGDFQRFYEGELLANRFNKSQKVSVFLLGTNTPRTGFGWGDMDKYGLENEGDYSWDEEMETFIGKEKGVGIPRTLNTGIYYNEKFGKRTKVNANYSFKENSLLTQSEQKSQYFLPDTSYFTGNINRTQNKTQNHIVNVSIEHELDSFSALRIVPKFTYYESEQYNKTRNAFSASNGELTRETENNNTFQNQGYDASSRFRYERNFRKKNRRFLINYYLDNSSQTGEGLLTSENRFYTIPLLELNNFDQKKEHHSSNMSHNANIIFNEPFGKKIQIESGYEFSYNIHEQNKSSLNKINDTYSQFDSIFSNDFITQKNINQGWIRFSYDVKKYSINIGAIARRVELNNLNRFTNSTIHQQVDNLLPYLHAHYSFDQNTRLRFSYFTNSQQPSLSQLQPLPNNANQNFITLGNPALKPTFGNSFRVTFNTYKPISGKYFFGTINYNLIQNAFSSDLNYDSLGRSVSRPVNVNGNYFGNTYISGGFPVFQKHLIINGSIEAGVFSNNNFINGNKNTTRNNKYGGSISFDINTEKIILEAGGNYEYNIPYSSINVQNNRPYTSQRYFLNGRIELPKKFFIEPEANYNLNSQRAAGYNINFLVLNASLTKYFGKLENFIVSVKAFDILNQNISADRQVYDNIITDSKTTVISRYFLLNVMYKFNSQKTKDNEEDYD